MERIKQAIENAKKSDDGIVSSSRKSHLHSQYTKSPRSAHSFRLDMAKYMAAFVLIILAGWLWMRLDFMNRLELMASEYINQGVIQARLEISRRLEGEARFKQLILDNLNHCQQAAEKDRELYVKLVRDAVDIKNENIKALNSEKLVKEHGKFTIPRDAVV